MFTNDLKKGTRIRLRNGWLATIWDNKKGNTRLAEVEGFCTEIGSVYSHDIEYVITQLDGDLGAMLEVVEHTPAQLKLMKQVEAMGF